MQKQAIYRKIGVTKDTELVLWFVCEKLEIEFTISRLRRLGLLILEDGE